MKHGDQLRAVEFGERVEWRTGCAGLAQLHARRHNVYLLHGYLHGARDHLLNRRHLGRGDGGHFAVENNE